MNKVVNNLSGETWLAVAKGIKDLASVNETTEEFKKKIIDKYAKKDEDGKPVLTDVRNEEGVVVAQTATFDSDEVEAKAKED